MLAYCYMFKVHIAQDPETPPYLPPSPNYSDLISELPKPGVGKQMLSTTG